MVHFGCFVTPIDRVNKTISSPQLLPLESVSVESRAFDFSAEVCVIQKYRRPKLSYIPDTPLECSYSFPLDEQACVVGFEAKVGAKVLVGIVKEKEQAKAEFKAAKAKGQQALLLDQHRVNEFTVQIGSILPGEEIEVKITYVTTLDLEGTLANRFVIPMQIAPKYSPNLYFGWQPDIASASESSGESGHQFAFMKQIAARSEVMTDSAASSAASRKDDIHSFLAPPKFALKAQFYTPIKVDSLTSPSHSDLVKVQIDGSQVPGGINIATATLDLDQSRHGRLVLERDLVLLVNLAQFESTRAMLEVNPKTGEQTMQVAFCPEKFDAELDADSLQVEMLFLIDESGSMGGARIGAVRDTLQLFLRSLPVRCKFNLVSFGSSYKTLFPESRLYSDESLKAASAYVSRLSADMGGTEIFEPLTYCLSSKLDAVFPRQIFLLTDGEVSNANQLITVARQFCQSGLGSSTTRIFTFGVGSSVDRALCKDLARAGGGECEFIGESGGASQSKELNEKVMRQLIKSLKPSLVDVKIEIEGCADAKLEQSPRIIPPIFAPNRTVVYLTGLNLPLDGSNNIRTLKISGLSNRCGDDAMEGVAHSARQSWSCTLDVSRRQSGAFLSKLAARARIGELQRGGVTEDATKQQIINLAVTHQISSNFTSFLIVDPEVNERRKCQDGKPGVFASTIVEAMDESETPSSNSFSSFAFGSAPSRSGLTRSAMPSSGGSRGGSRGGGGMMRKRLSGKSNVAPAQPCSMVFGSAPPPPAAAPADCSTLNDLLSCNLDKLSDRGEKLESLTVQSESLSSSSLQFSKSASSSGGGFFGKVSNFFSKGSPSSAQPQKQQQQQQPSMSSSMPFGSPPPSSAASVAPASPMGFSFGNTFGGSSGGSSWRSSSAPLANTADSCFQQLVQLQSASGLWSLDQQFIQLVQQHVSYLPSSTNEAHRSFLKDLTIAKVESIANQYQLPSNIVASLIAMFLFDTAHSHRSSEVTMLLSKSKKAVTKALNGGVNKGKDIAGVTQEILAA